MIASFAPVIGTEPRLLVLGSIPGVLSLQAQAYYAHPRNAFWPIMAELLGFDPELPYPERLHRLTDAGIALWDVVRQCERPGSLDSRIRPASVTPNDIGGLLEREQSIARILFNGKAAEQWFHRHFRLPGSPRNDRRVLPRPLDLITLPSTSPAHASLSRADKRRRWADALTGLKR